MSGKWFSILFLLIFHSNSFPQNTVDSLKALWDDQTLADTTRLNAIHKIAWDGYLYSQPDSTFYYAQLEYEFARKKGLKKQMADALNIQGASFYIRGNYANAIDYYKHSLKIRKEIKDKQGIAASLNNIGNIYIGQGDYRKAINYYTRSLKIFERIGDRQKISISLNNIGNIYKNQGDYDNAIGYHTRCLKIEEEINDKQGIAASLNNIGNIFSDKGDYTKAIDHHTRSLMIREEIGDKKGIAASLNNIGNIYKNQDNYANAIDYYTRSLTIMEEIDYKQGIATSLNNIGIVYNKMGDSAHSAGNTALSADKYTKAIKYSARALIIAKEVGTVIEIKDAANNLYEAYKHIGNPNASLEMYELYITMRDSIENIETQREVIRQEYKYNYEKQALADSIAFVKQQELNALVYQTQRDKERYALLGGFVLLLILLAVYLRIRFIKKQAEKEALLQQIKLLKAETIVKMASSATLTEQLQLNKEKIEAAIDATLNQSDWNILNALYNNPAISNREIAEEVSLSVEGVYSSLKKMYKHFGVKKMTENQRIAIIIEAVKISSESSMRQE